MSFWEFSIVIVVGLLVIGPARLPEAIKTGFKWFTKVKKTINDVRTDFEKQIGADEIRRELRNEEIMKNLDELKAVRKQLEQAAETIQDDEHGTTIDGEHEELSDEDFSEYLEHDDPRYYKDDSEIGSNTDTTTENSIGNIETNSHALSSASNPKKSKTSS